MKKNLFIIFVCAILNVAWAEQLPITDQVNADLKTLVNINSHTLNPTGVRQVGEYLRPKFEAIGFNVKWIPNHDPRYGDHLLITRSGKGPHILLLGHMDTVFPKDSPFQTYQEKGDTISGPGVYDMKGGLLAMLYALEAMNAEGALAGKHITVFLTGDEEQSAQPWEVTRKPLLDIAKTADYAICFEIARALDVAVIERRGVTNWVLEVNATGGHSSRITQADLGFGATYHVSRILQSMRESMTHYNGLTINPGLVAAGSTLADNNTGGFDAIGSPNILASHAKARGDIRYVSIDQFNQATASLQKNLNDPQDPHSKATLTFFKPKPAMELKPGNEKLLLLLSEINVALGENPVKSVDRMTSGASDMNTVCQYVPACIDGIGVLGGGAHSESEWMSLKDFPFIVERAKRFIMRLDHL